VQQTYPRMPTEHLFWLAIAVVCGVSLRSAPPNRPAPRSITLGLATSLAFVAPPRCFLIHRVQSHCAARPVPAAIVTPSPPHSVGVSADLSASPAAHRPRRRPSTSCPAVCRPRPAAAIVASSAPAGSMSLRLSRYARPAAGSRGPGALSAASRRAGRTRRLRSRSSPRQQRYGHNEGPQHGGTARWPCKAHRQGELLHRFGRR